MNNRRPGTRNDDRNDDIPPYSKIFIVCHKQTRIESLRSVFQTYGHIEDLRVPADRVTGDPKGIAYVKYSKTSSAAAAIKEMHLKTIDDCSKPIRVMIATTKHDNPNTNDEKYKRLFIKVGREQTETDIKEHFSNYGQVESVYIQKDKTTNESRGFAYVYFKTFLDAALALEECDRKYKPVFAAPKDELKRSRNSVENYVDSHHSSSSSIAKSNNYEHYNHSREDIYSKDNTISIIKTKAQDYDTVCVTCSPQVQQKFLEKLFNIIPGMIQFKYMADSFNGFCKATATYETEIAAACAVEKLNNFEFPSGEIVSVQPDNNPLSKAANNLNNIVNNLKSSMDGNPDLMQLADAIAQASTLIKAATSGRDIKAPQEDFCSVSLPPVQPLASTSKVVQRCFLVCKPHPPPVSALKDAFCRFGDLIDVSTFPNKTFGFAKYASEAAAQEAIKTLHGAVLCGIKLKVLEAEKRPYKDENTAMEEDSSIDHDTERKRMKFQDSDSNMSG